MTAVNDSQLASKSEFPWQSERNARLIKSAVIILFVLSGLLLFAWPIASFVALFIFDAPIKGLMDALIRYTIVFAIWLYPVFWSTALIIAIMGLKKKFRTAVLIFVSSIPFLVAATPFLLFELASHLS